MDVRTWNDFRKNEQRLVFQCSIWNQHEKVQVEKCTWEKSLILKTGQKKDAIPLDNNSTWGPRHQSICIRLSAVKCSNIGIFIPWYIRTSFTWNDPSNFSFAPCTKNAHIHMEYTRLLLYTMEWQNGLIHLSFKFSIRFIRWWSNFLFQIHRIFSHTHSTSRLRQDRGHDYGIDAEMKAVEYYLFEVVFEAAARARSRGSVGIICISTGSREMKKKRKNGRIDAGHNNRHIFPRPYSLYCFSAINI